MTLIFCRELSKAYSDRQVVKHVSFGIAPQQTTVIVGESGSGKTTLLRMLACLLEPDSGTIFLENSPLMAYAQYLVKGHPDIKLVAQDYQLYPNISIKENIAYALRFYEKSYQADRVATLLQLLGLELLRDKLPRQLSGGEQQRVALAQALADTPKILLLDEPFSHLDSLNKNKLKIYLQRVIEQEEITCLMVTHDLIDALDMGQQIGLMHQGELLQIGLFSELLHQPTHAYVSEFFEAALVPLRRVVALGMV